MRAKLNGTEIYFDIDGPQLGVDRAQLRARPTIVALHGGPGFDHGYLKPGLGPLRDSAQVVYVDLRGQGRSGRPQLDSCTLEQMADDVAALCAHVGIERPVVFGHSAGGFVALHLQLRHPDLASGLILCDSMPTHVPIDDDVPRPTLASRAGADVLAAASRLFGGDMSPESLAEFGEKVLPFYGGPSHMDVSAPILGLSGMSTDLMQYYFGNLAPRYDVRSRLGEIRVPTLIIVGRHDWVCPPPASRAMARGIPHAKLVELADAGHFGFSEEPAQFQAAVRELLDALGPGSIMGTASDT